MRKQLMTGLVIVAASYSATTLAASGKVAGSGNIGSGAWGTDNWVQTCATGCNPGLAGDGPGNLGASLARVFFANVELHFDLDGVLVTPDGTPFTGTTTSGDVYKNGKKI